MAAAPAAQAAIDIIPAYNDGRERFLNVTKQRNDHFLLNGSSEAVPMFALSAAPESELILLGASDPHFSYQSNILTVNNPVSAVTISAYFSVDHSSGFLLRVDYTHM